jgi:hypothetical protein
LRGRVTKVGFATPYSFVAASFKASEVSTVGEWPRLLTGGNHQHS